MGFLNSPRRKLRRLAGLTAGERRTLLQAAALLALVAVGRRLMRVQRLRAALERLMPLRAGPARDEAATLAEARRIAWLVGAAASHDLMRANCLERSLVLATLLRRRGITSELHLGARRDGEGFEAHAWVERRGVVLNDGEDVRERYVAFTAPASAAERSKP